MTDHEAAQNGADRKEPARTLQNNPPDHIGPEKNLPEASGGPAGLTSKCQKMGPRNGFFRLILGSLAFYPRGQTRGQWFPLWGNLCPHA